MSFLRLFLAEWMEARAEKAARRRRKKLRRALRHLRTCLDVRMPMDLEITKHVMGWQLHLDPGAPDVVDPEQGNAREQFDAFYKKHGIFQDENQF